MVIAFLIIERKGSMHSKTLFHQLVAGAYLLASIGMTVVAAGVIRLSIAYDAHLAAILMLGTAVFVTSAITAKLIEARRAASPAGFFRRGAMGCGASRSLSAPAELRGRI